MKIAKLEKLYGMDEEEKQAFDIEYQKEIKMNPMFVQQQQQDALYQKHERRMEYLNQTIAEKQKVQREELRKFLVAKDMRIIELGLEPKVTAALLEKKQRMNFLGIEERQTNLMNWANRSKSPDTRRLSPERSVGDLTSAVKQLEASKRGGSRNKKNTSKQKKKQANQPNHKTKIQIK